MNKIISLFFLHILLFSTSAFANNIYTPIDLSRQVPFIVPPPVYSQQNNLMIFFISGSYTYWKPYQEEMFIASTSIVDPTTNPITKDWLQTTMKARNGFKASLGINTFYDGWKIESEYTFFYNSPNWTKHLINYKEYNHFSPFIYDQVGSNFFYLRELSSRFRNRFQEVNLTINRPFYAGDYLIICPKLGLLAALETQNLDVKGSGTGVSLEHFSSDSYQVKNFSCIGPYSKLSSTYFLTDFLGLYFSLAGALNLGYHGTSTQFYQNQVLSQSLITRSKVWKIDPMLETSLGLQLDYFSNIFGILVKAGWDMQVWFNHNTFVKAIPYWPYEYNNQQATKSVTYQTCNGNYSMQGLTVSLEIAF